MWCVCSLHNTNCGYEVCEINELSERWKPGIVGDIVGGNPRGIEGLQIGPQSRLTRPVAGYSFLRTARSLLSIAD